MPKYKEMYLQLFKATETAIEIITAAQHRCEELCIDTPDELRESGDVLGSYSEENKVSGDEL